MIKIIVHPFDLLLGFGSVSFGGLIEGVVAPLGIGGGFKLYPQLGQVRAESLT